MSDSDLIQGLEELFRETGQAHHQAFLSTDGADPEWPIWYAAYLMDRIGELQKVEFTKSELVYLLVLVSKEQAVKDPGADWTEYYARLTNGRTTRSRFHRPAGRLGDASIHSPPRKPAR